MRIFSFAVAASVLCGCGVSDAVVTEEDVTAEVADNALVLTPRATLLLPEPGARFVGANATRTRVIVQGATNARSCAPLKLLDLVARTVTTLGGEDLFCGPFTLAPVFSPDAKAVAVWAFDQPRNTWDLYLWTEAQPTLRKVASHPDQVETNELSMLHFSADGKFLVYVPGVANAAGYPLMAYSLESGTATQVSSSASLVAPRMSPDGARMVFLADGLGARKVMAWRFSTKTATELGRGHDWSLHVSPDRARVVFSSQCTGDATGAPVCELREWSFTTTAPRLLGAGVRETFGFAAKAPVLAWRGETSVETWHATSGQRTSIAGACWAGLSGDGLKLAWLGACTAATDGNVSGELRVGAVGATSSTKVASSVSRGAVGFEPRLNLDGTRLTYGVAGALTLWSAGSSYPKQLATNDQGAFTGLGGSHVFSPDGKRLVFEKSTSWVNPFLCPPYGVCGYRELLVRDVSSSWGSDRSISTGSAWSTEKYRGFVTSEWAHSPDGKRVSYLVDALGTAKLYALQTESRNSYRIGKVEGSTYELSVVMGDGFAAVANGVGVTLYSGLD